MKRLLFVTTSYFTLRAFLRPYAEHFRQLGWRVDALAQGATGCSECREMFDKVWEIEWTRNPLAAANLWQTPRRVRQVVSDGDYDIVHVHTPIAAFVTRWALRHRLHAGRPQVIYTAHGFHFHQGRHFLWNKTFLGLERLAGAWTDYLIVINGEDHQAAERSRLVPPERLRLMPGIGVSLHQYGVADGDAAAQVRRELNITSEDVLFLMIGEFNRNKRHSDLLQAFSRLQEGRAHLALAGEGKLRSLMQQRAIDLGVEQRVHFLGFRRDIPSILAASAATILPSKREGLPRSLMESFCMGVPGIGSDIRGIRDLLSPDCGLLVQSGDVDGLAGAMRWVLAHPEKAREMGKRGRERMKDFEIGRLLHLHEELYSEVLQD